MFDSRFSECGGCAVLWANTLICTEIRAGVLMKIVYVKNEPRTICAAFWWLLCARRSGV